MIDPITDPRGAVAEFMRAAGQECPDQPVRLSPAIQELRRSLILEEIREFQQAADLYEKYGTNDALVAVADALADIAYVTIGAMVAQGLTDDIDPRWGALSLSDKNAGLFTNRLAVESCVVQGLASYCQAARADLAYYGLRTCWAGLSGGALFYDIPLAEVFAEVHRSNMTKFVKCCQLDADCPACNGTGYASVKRDDGKIMKPPTYQPPNIAAVLRQHGRIN